MSNEVDLVFNGFVRLRASEKDDVLRRIREYNGANPTKRELLERQSFAAIKKIALGPKGEGCPCCGRS